MFLFEQLKAFEKERQSEKRILESDLVDYLLQKLRIKVLDERNNRCDKYCSLFQEIKTREGGEGRLLSITIHPIFFSLRGR